jgi:hypothetical protein
MALKERPASICHDEALARNLAAKISQGDISEKGGCRNAPAIGLAHPSPDAFSSLSQATRLSLTTFRTSRCFPISYLRFSICLPIYLRFVSRSAFLSSYILHLYLPSYPPTFRIPICFPNHLPFVSLYLSIFLSLYLSISLSLYPSIPLSLYPSIFLSFYLSIFLSFYLSIFLSFYLSICLSVYLSICLSVYRSTHLYLYLSTLRTSI